MSLSEIYDEGHEHECEEDMSANLEGNFSKKLLLSSIEIYSVKRPANRYGYLKAVRYAEIKAMKTNGRKTQRQIWKSKLKALYLRCYTYLFLT